MTFLHHDLPKPAKPTYSAPSPSDPQTLPAQQALPALVPRAALLERTPKPLVTSRRDSGCHWAASCHVPRSAVAIGGEATARGGAAPSFPGPPGGRGGVAPGDGRARDGWRCGGSDAEGATTRFFLSEGARGSRPGALLEDGGRPATARGVVLRT